MTVRTTGVVVATVSKITIGRYDPVVTVSYNGKTGCPGIFDRTVIVLPGVPW
jgi:hypothetical protein